MVDSYSKWIEVELMKHGTDASKVIRKFSVVFARFGLPDVLVTDGGPPFNSSNFITFMKSSNGQAERMVRVVKDVFKKFILDPQTRSLEIKDRITLFLANYRKTCSASDGKFPSEKVSHFSRNLSGVFCIQKDNINNVWKNLKGKEMKLYTRICLH